MNETNRRRSHREKLETSAANTPYIAPKALADRWQCARSTVDRIARREGFTRVCLGSGKNGMVRYLRNEVEAFEAARSIQMVP